ncbi:class I SAM-dependent methyltransferase [Lyngbya confervoides]|uniref:Methyltransferase domain-containing protein n=1 Tax=Lyngbya confervoides BDU141951 TaxID=1574623 RepID=A0ABD4SZ24_9CYAN|nr:class I SAM-dependent methyltransferase [Lyngbya confervoides]MCM1981618.1 methyltransferase domain-containing protein [Lyngbya confervoides BDU141951]
MTQTWDAKSYATNARFVSELGMPVIEWLNPKPGDRILDLGCGDGVLTAKLQELGCEVIGVDSSPDLIHSAKSLGLDARLLDGHNLHFNGEFDAVFSNAALHWIKQPDRVIEGVWWSLKPGGRFVGEFGGDGNVAKIVTALHTALKTRGIDPEPINPWYFPTIKDYQSRLEARGFRINAIDIIPRPTTLPTDLRGWLATFAHQFTAAIATTEREAFLEEVINFLKADLCNEAGQWVADYIRLRFSASKPLNLP